MHNRTKILLCVTILAIFGLVYYLFQPDVVITDTKQRTISTINYFRSPVKNVVFNEYVNIIRPISKNNSFVKASLRSAGRSMVIYVHHKDDMISSSILAYGIWEGSLVMAFTNYIRSHPGIQVLDLGCNIGVYTLSAAALGTKVVAIDANANNIDRLAQSVVDNGFVDNVQILLNAVTNTRKEFVMTINNKNIGSQNILENNSDPRRVKGIFINDLVPLFDVKKDVMIKIDIEGREIEAFQKAELFFQEFNVKLVLIEWEWIKKYSDITFLLKFFSERHFKPYRDISGTVSLNVAGHLTWPMDVVWIKS